MRRAKLVRDKCGGLSLAIKVRGRAMASITDEHAWELAILRLPNTYSQDHQVLHDRLRWSYDADLELCSFVYLAGAFTEDEIIEAQQEFITFWVGEGLLKRNECGLEKGCWNGMSVATNHLRLIEFMSIF